MTFRVHFYGFDLGGTRFSIQIARSVESLKQEIYELMYIIASGFFVATILLMILSYFLTHKILEPIVRINRLAKDISASHMTQRVPLGKSRDELYELSQSLNSMFDRLQHSFESQKQLVADAAHELKSPITMILLFLERSMERKDLPADYAGRLNTQIDILRRMGRLIKNLLDISVLEQPDALKLETLDLKILVDKVLEDFEIVFLTWEIQVKNQILGEFRVHGDREKLHRMMVNLIDNAVKYNIKGGRIEIAAAGKRGGIEISVWNTGVGIPEKDLKNVLKTFYRVEKSRSKKYGGSGLGLTIVHRIAVLHGGNVVMKSEPGKWCRAVVFLPDTIGREKNEKGRG